MDYPLLHRIKNTFETEFGKNPTTVFSPGRINLIGGHVDYNDGFVFPAAIDKGIVVAICKSDEENCTALAIDFEEAFTFSLENLKAEKNGGWRNYLIGVVVELQKNGCHIEPFNIAFGGNLPLGAGLSSSAALENGIVYSLNQLFDLGLTKLEMIKISQKAEHLHVGVNCGIMDQYASMFGKENHFILLDCLNLKAEAYQACLTDYDLVLINSKVQHKLSDSTYNQRRKLCEEVATLLQRKSLRGVTEEDLQGISHTITKEEQTKVLYVVQEMDRVNQAAAAFSENNILKVGELLFQAHHGASTMYEISCAEIDFLVQCAKNSKDVIGARMMGGGFGGCTINIIKKGKVDSFFEETKNAFKNQFGHECALIKVKLSNGTKQINIVNEPARILS